LWVGHASDTNVGTRTVPAKATYDPAFDGLARKLERAQSLRAQPP